MSRSNAWFSIVGFLHLVNLFLFQHGNSLRSSSTSPTNSAQQRNRSSKFGRRNSFYAFVDVSSIDQSTSPIVPPNAPGTTPFESTEDQSLGSDRTVEGEQRMSVSVLAERPATEENRSRRRSTTEITDDRAGSHPGKSHRDQSG